MWSSNCWPGIVCLTFDWAILEECLGSGGDETIRTGELLPSLFPSALWPESIPRAHRAIQMHFHLIYHPHWFGRG